MEMPELETLGHVICRSHAKEFKAYISAVNALTRKYEVPGSRNLRARARPIWLRGFEIGSLKIRVSYNWFYKTDAELRTVYDVLLSDNPVGLGRLTGEQIKSSRLGAGPKPNTDNFGQLLILGYFLTRTEIVISVGPAAGNMLSWPESKWATVDSTFTMGPPADRIYNMAEMLGLISKKTSRVADSKSLIQRAREKCKKIVGDVLAENVSGEPKKYGGLAHDLAEIVLCQNMCEMAEIVLVELEQLAEEWVHSSKPSSKLSSECLETLLLFLYEGTFNGDLRILLRIVKVEHYEDNGTRLTNDDAVVHQTREKLCTPSFFRNFERMPFVIRADATGVVVSTNTPFDIIVLMVIATCANIGVGLTVRGEETSSVVQTVVAFSALTYVTVLGLYKNLRYRSWDYYDLIRRQYRARTVSELKRVVSGMPECVKLLWKVEDPELVLSPGGTCLFTDKTCSGAFIIDAPVRINDITSNFGRVNVRTNIFGILNLLKEMSGEVYELVKSHNNSKYELHAIKRDYLIFSGRSTSSAERYLTIGGCDQHEDIDKQLV